VGSISYAAGGALAGAGKGVAEVGEIALKQQVQEGLMRLQKQYAEEMQQKGFEHQAGMQQAQFAEQEKLTKQQITARGALAQAEMKQKEELAARHEAGATERANIAAGPRYAMANARKEAANKPAQPKPWQVKNVNTTEIVNGVPTTTSRPLLFNPNSNALYAPVGDKLIRWDTSTNKPAVDPAVFARKPVDPAELTRLYADPNGVIPGGFKGGGMTNAENFERIHHYIPAGLTSHLTQGGMVGEKSPTATGEMSPEESAEFNAPSPPEEPGYDAGYGNTGDEGPQASDTEAAH